MKTALLSGLALLATAHIANAQVLASDDFSYTGALTANGWGAHSGAGNKVVMSDGSVATLDQSGGSGEDVNIAFTAQTATDTTYASFSFSVSASAPIATDANGLYFAHFKDSGFNFTGRTGIVMPAGAGDFGLAYHSDSSSLGAGATWAGDLSFDTTYNVVISWDATVDGGSLWLDPTSMGSTSVSHSNGTSIGDLVEGFALRQSNDLTAFIAVDNVVVGKTFADVAPSTSTGTAYCFGDGTATACPCGNNNDGSNGDAGCANGSFAGGASLTGAGTASVSADTVVLTATGVEPSQPGLFFSALNQVNGGMGLTFGDGLRCAGGSVVRLGTVFSDGSGVAVSNPSVGAGLAGGDIRRYQYWYRNPTGSTCGEFFNLSNGYEINWGI